MTKAKIEKILQETFQPEFLEVIDDGHKHIGHEGAKQGGHFSVTIVSAAFKGVKVVDRHRMVYEALKPIKGLIHALAIAVKPPVLDN
jgi:BolA protein